MQEVLPDQRSFVLEIRFHSLSVEGIFEFPSLRGSLEQKEWVTRIGSDNKRNPHISMKKWSLTESNCFSRISHYPLIPTKPAPGARPPLLTNSDNKFNSFSKQKKQFIRFSNLSDRTSSIPDHCNPHKDRSRSLFCLSYHWMELVLRATIIQ